MSEDVVTPEGSWGKILKEIRSDEREPSVDLNDMRLTELSEHPGWKILKEYLEARIESIRDMFRGKIGQDTYEIIGQKAIISDIIQDELQTLINKVENTSKEVKTQEAKKVKK